MTQQANTSATIPMPTIPTIPPTPATMATPPTPTMPMPDVLLLQIMAYLPRDSYLPICHVSKRFRFVWRDLRMLMFEIERRQRAAAALSQDDQFDEDNQEDDGEEEDIGDRLYQTNPSANVYDDFYPAGAVGKGNKAKAPTLRTELLRYYLSCGLKASKSPLNAVLIRAAALGDTAGMSYLVDQNICDGTATITTTCISSIDNGSNTHTAGSTSNSSIGTTTNRPINVGVAACNAAASAGQIDAVIYSREVFGFAWDARQAYAAADRGVQCGRAGCHSVKTYIYLNSDDIAGMDAGMPV